MTSWYEETAKKIFELKKQGYYHSWIKREIESIIFLFEPTITIEEQWINRRKEIYFHNAKLLKVSSPAVTFYVYPSKEFGRELGLTPAISFPQKKEIHGHLKQSPGHELTHILLREINSANNFLGGGIWSEGICTYLDGNETNRKIQARSLRDWENLIKTPWKNWRKKLPDDIYPVGASIIQFFTEKFGWQTVLELIKNLKDGGSNEEELSLKIFKKSFVGLQSEWIEWMEK